MCGVGGRTIAEAKQNMSYDEFVAWCKYRSLQGGLNIGLRVDRAVSRALAVYFNAMSKGKKLKPHDFSPYDQESPVDVDDVDQVFNTLKSIAHGKSRHADS